MRYIKGWPEGEGEAAMATVRFLTECLEAEVSVPSSPSLSASLDTLPVGLSIQDLAYESSKMTVSPIEAALAQPQVYMKNRTDVLRKLTKMSTDGAKKLLVISDFDHTISRAYDEQGVRCWTTHGVFDNEPSLKDDLGAKFTKLTNKYLPIEFDENLSIQEKIPHMIEWWEVSHSYMVEAGFSRHEIEGFVAKSYVRLRDNAKDTLATLKDHGVPLVLFSAGIGDVIDIFLKQQIGEVFGNIHLISNMMKFDDKGKLTGFSRPLIHTFNKNSSVIQKEESFFHEMNSRGNVILMGDSMGDLHMDVGVENHNEQDTLKIGFLNHRPHLLEHYIELYDIVLNDDQSMDVPNAILRHIIGPSPADQ